MIYSAYSTLGIEVIPGEIVRDIMMMGVSSAKGQFMILGLIVLISLLDNF